MTSLVAAPGTDGGIVGWAMTVMEAMGGPGAAVLVALESLFPPIPSEAILPLAGFTASQGEMSVLGAILWTTAGSLVGAIALYCIGALVGIERTRAIAAKLPLVKLSDIDRTEEWFAKHGGKAVFFGRMIPLFRSFISLPAGVERMPLPSFVALTAAGSAIWNTGLVLAGYLLGESWTAVESYVGIVSKVVVGLVAVALVIFIGRRMREDTRR